MGLIAEQDSVTDGYETIELPSGAENAQEQEPVILCRRSARPSRRAVLYLHCLDDEFVPDDLASWYTERGFHFYVADLRNDAKGERAAGGKRRAGKSLRARFPEIDAACAYLRDSAGIDALIVGAHAAGAVAAALWCDSRRESRPADAMILTSPAFGRRERGPLDIPCPVLVISPPAEPPAGDGKAAKSRKRADRRGGPETMPLGRHVTWLRLRDGLEPGSAAGRPDADCAEGSTAAGADGTGPAANVAAEAAVGAGTAGTSRLTSADQAKRTSGTGKNGSGRGDSGAAAPGKDDGSPADAGRAGGSNGTGLASGTGSASGAGRGETGSTAGSGSGAGPGGKVGSGSTAASVTSISGARQAVTEASGRSAGTGVAPRPGTVRAGTVQPGTAHPGTVQAGTVQPVALRGDRVGLAARLAAGTGLPRPRPAVRAAARPADDRQRFFDEVGRWLGAYMYGQVRDQLL